MRATSGVMRAAFGVRLGHVNGALRLGTICVSSDGGVPSPSEQVRVINTDRVTGGWRDGGGGVPVPLACWG